MQPWLVSDNLILVITSKFTIPCPPSAVGMPFRGECIPYKWKTATGMADLMKLNIVLNLSFLRYGELSPGSPHTSSALFHRARAPSFLRCFTSLLRLALVSPISFLCLLRAGIKSVGHHILAKSTAALFCFSFENSVFCSLGWPQVHCVAKDELLILLLLPPKFCHYRHITLYPEKIWSINSIFFHL